MNKFWYLLSLSLLIAACQVKPQEIAYGSDACSFCKMTIVDTQHAAEIVTEKGKAFKYDAIECMLNHMQKWDGTAVKYHLVTDYSNPKILVDATQMHYLISEAIPSPMGANLTAFGDLDELQKVIVHADGQTMGWQQLLEAFQRK